MYWCDWDCWRKRERKKEEKCKLSLQLGVKYLGDNAINVVLLPIFKEMAQNLELLSSQSKNAISHMQITRCQLALTVGAILNLLNLHYDIHYDIFIYFKDVERGLRIGDYRSSGNTGHSRNWSEFYLTSYSRRIWEKAGANSTHQRYYLDRSCSTTLLSSYGWDLGYLWSCNLEHCLFIKSHGYSSDAYVGVVGHCGSRKCRRYDWVSTEIAHDVVATFYPSKTWTTSKLRWKISLGMR